MMQCPGNNKVVLVTGASDLFSMYVIIELLRQGYQVRATVSQAADKNSVCQAIGDQVGQDKLTDLSCVVKPLLSGESWDDICEGCDQVIHNILNKTEIIEPMVDDSCTDNGMVVSIVSAMERVMQSAIKKTSQMVITSSYAAVVFGRRPSWKKYSIEDWSNPDYLHCGMRKGVTYAEQLAWRYMSILPKGENFHLTVFCPYLMLGPILISKQAISAHFITDLLFPLSTRIPRLNYGICDVRDIAALHVQALDNVAAYDERWLCNGDNMWCLDIARALFDHGYTVPLQEEDDVKMQQAIYADPSLYYLCPYLGKVRCMNQSATKRVFKWKNHSAIEAIQAMADSLTAQEQENPKK